MVGKKLIIISILLLSNLDDAGAQEKGMYNTFHKLVNVNHRVFFSEKFYEKALFFTINMVVNEKGGIDSVIFSDEKNEDLNHLFDFPKISRELKKNKIDFVQHKNEILVLLVMVSRGEYYLLGFKNGEEIVNNWNQISSVQDKMKTMNKKQIFLSPLIINAKGSTRYDKP